jgi:hypothetical protein
MLKDRIQFKITKRGILDKTTVMNLIITLGSIGIKNGR